MAALQAFDAPTSSMPKLVQRVVASLPAVTPPLSPLVTFVPAPPSAALDPDDVVPAAPVRPVSTPPRPVIHDEHADPPWAGDLDDDPWAV